MGAGSDARKDKGPAPFREPALPLSDRSAARNSALTWRPRKRRPGSRLPHSDEDNETLGHLLSAVEQDLQYGTDFPVRKPLHRRSSERDAGGGRFVFAPGPAALAFSATLVATEITGSETFIHADFGPDRWVGLVEGVHELPPGQVLPLWLDPAHVYLFDAEGRLAAPASYAKAA